MEQAPTRAAALALKEERKVVREAYEFLDEKRLLLAGELLRHLGRYARAQEELATLAATAREQLRAAVRGHGLQGVTVYPAGRLDGFRLQTRQQNFMGVMLLENTPELPATGPDRQPAACHPSREAEACRAAFEQLLRASATLAGITGNIHRLLREYRLTERRARALENVILPELEHSLDTLTTRLEEMDLEEVIRAHRYGLAPAR
jgi:V/A-type H+-transporting ATPase subunit D